MKKRKKQPVDCSDCAEVEKLIAEYMDGEADAELASALLLHAQSCAHCAALLRSLKRLVHYCSLEPNCEMPVAVRKELWVTIRRELRVD
jgi:anti-sigma factor RsiW